MTSFVKKFNERQSNIKRYQRGHAGIAGKHYAYFYEEGIKVPDKTIVVKADVNKPKYGKGICWDWTFMCRMVGKSLVFSLIF